MSDSVFPESSSNMSTYNSDKEKPKDSILNYPEIGPSSASVPIPGSYRGAHHNQDQLSPSPQANPAVWGHNFPDNFSFDSTHKFENQDVLDPSAYKMDDDDIFQVDKADLIQGPTLAELNANEDTLLGDLNFDDLLLPNENMQSFSNSAYDFQSNNTLSTVSNFGIGNSSNPSIIQGCRSLPQPATLNIGIGFSGLMYNSDPIESVNLPVHQNSKVTTTAG